MPHYEIIGIGAKTGRRRKRVYWEKNEEKARVRAEQDGTIIKSLHVLPSGPPTEAQLKLVKNLKIKVPAETNKDEVSTLIGAVFDSEPATKNQIRYAHGLGIILPPNVKKGEISELIDAAVGEKRAQELPQYLVFAQIYNVDASDCVCKQDVFDRILDALRKPGREVELMSWYTYRVYRTLVNGSRNTQINSPAHPSIHAIALLASRNPTLVASVRRNHHSGTSNLIHFFDSGKRIAAFREVSRLLCEQIPEIFYYTDEDSTITSNTSGCLWLVGLIVFFVVLLITFLWKIMSFIFHS